MRNKKLMLRMAFLMLFSSLLGACATAVGRSGRVGLFDRIEGKSGRSSRIASVDEKDLVETPDPEAVLPLTGEWQWPLERIDPSSQFGERGKKFHQGIDLRANMRTPVYAAADGKVVYVGSKIRGYGRMVVLKHANNIYTVYAHHSKNVAKAGMQVNRGDLIAYSGKSGHSTGPHLHFEIRKGTVSYDPMLAINEHVQNHQVDRRFASVAAEPVRKKKNRRNSKRGSRGASNKTAAISKKNVQNL